MKKHLESLGFKQTFKYANVGLSFTKGALTIGWFPNSDVKIIAVKDRNMIRAYKTDNIEVINEVLEIAE